MDPIDAPSRKLGNECASLVVCPSDGEGRTELEDVLGGAGSKGKPCSFLSLLVNRCARNSASSVLRSAALRGGLCDKPVSNSAPCQ